MTSHEALLERLAAEGIEQVRVAWGDLHGTFRGKTLVGAEAVSSALQRGVGFVSTLMLKDSSDRTAFKVFEPGALDALPGFGAANNVLLRPDASSFRVLPWAPATGWMRAEPRFEDGTPVMVDPRRVLQAALGRLHGLGYTLRCGLEIEFHIYRIVDDRLALEDAAWPHEPPLLRLIHPGYQLLSEAWADLAEEPLAIVRRTALALGLPLRSLEIELGPSQVEAVFDATDALTAADHMLLFRNHVRQALRRAGYHASFVCKPPEPPCANAVASGWHLHQSLADAQGRNAMVGQAPHLLSQAGSHWLAGLLAHAPAAVALCAPTVSAYGRFRGSVMAPQAAVWARDNRGAMLRVVGTPGDSATRIENRVGEPLANPYLMIASQVLSGIDGLERRLPAPPAVESPYAADLPALPASLSDALAALKADAAICEPLGQAMVHVFETIKRQEIARFEQAEDKAQWLRREYFARY